jgi:hypothetical protein
MVEVRRAEGYYKKNLPEVFGRSGDGPDDKVWDKVGQAIGNLQALTKLRIYALHEDHEDRHFPSTSDWEILTRILSQVRQKIEVEIAGIFAWCVEQSRGFARAIHGHPTITSFVEGDDDYYFPYESLDALYSALATLPALESIDLRMTAPDDESGLSHPESLTELLRAPSLRSVCFREFDFTRAV